MVKCKSNRPPHKDTSMTYRVLLSALAMFGFVALCARGDVLTVRGKDPVTGLINKESTKEVSVSAVVAKKKTELKIPSADIIDVQYDNIRPAALTEKGGAFRGAREAEKEADEGTTPAGRTKAMATAIRKY